MRSCDPTQKLPLRAEFLDGALLIVVSGAHEEKVRGAARRQRGYSGESGRTSR